MLVKETAFGLLDGFIVPLSTKQGKVFVHSGNPTDAVWARSDLPAGVVVVAVAKGAVSGFINICSPPFL